MKNLKLLFLTMFLSISLMPAHLAASVPVPTVATTSAPTPAAGNAIELKSRLAEIKGMDKSGLNASEKKQLRKEKRAIKSDLRQIKGGVYVSVGALLVILIVLIILL